MDMHLNRRCFVAAIAASALLGAGLGPVVAYELPPVTPGVEVSAAQANAAAQAGRATFIDIRQPEEWRETGVPKGAKRVSWRHTKGEEGFVADVLASAGGDKAAPIILICRTGNRSAQAQKLLQTRGFTQVWHVGEGVAGSKAGAGWAKAGLPLE